MKHPKTYYTLTVVLGGVIATLLWLLFRAQSSTSIPFQ